MKSIYSRDEMQYKAGLRKRLYSKGLFKHERSEAERNKNGNTATAVTTKLQRSDAAQSVDMLH